jgi:probable addiction module antidote protein
MSFLEEVVKRIHYPKLVFDHYLPICSYCGFSIPELLEVAYLDGNKDNNEIENLVIFCPNCHKMHGLDLIPSETVIQLRDREKQLETDEDMAVCLEAALEGGGPALVAAALREVARARGMAQIAHETGLGGESLYKALWAEDHPELATMLKVLGALGLGLRAITAHT